MPIMRLMLPALLCMFAAIAAAETLSEYGEIAEDKRTDYVWIVVVGALVSFFTAYGIGANDVANAFATSVGAGSITLPWAIVIAGIFEFLGAFLLGASVADTIRSGIADFDAFNQYPEVFMYGMLCALTSTGVWLLVATMFEMPVSTTHSIVGGIVGWSLVVSPDAVVWSKSSDDFPYFKGISAIVTSWFVSPIASGVVAAALYLLVRTFVLRSSSSYQRVWIFLPILVFLTISINVWYVIAKGASGIEAAEDMVDNKLWLTFVIAMAVGLVVAIGVAAATPFYRRLVDRRMQKADEVKSSGKGPEEREPSRIERAIQRVLPGTKTDVHAVVETDEAVSNIHDNQERFDTKTEEAFKVLQVFTAICDSFSHGANDVANSIGPFAAIWSVYLHGRLNEEATVPRWILAFGGIGIVVGLGTYGYNIIRALGVKLLAVTPSRGFAIELGTALVIALGSYLGLPLSTTHCQVGGEVGVGALEGKSGIHWRLLAKIFGGWVITLIVAGTLSAILFSLGAFAPSIQMTEELNEWRAWAGNNLEGVRLAALEN